MFRVNILTLYTKLLKKGVKIMSVITINIKGEYQIINVRSKKELFHLRIDPKVQIVAINKF